MTYVVHNISTIFLISHQQNSHELEARSPEPTPEPSTPNISGGVYTEEKKGKREKPWCPLQPPLKDTEFQKKSPKV